MKITILGMGPGDIKQMTKAADEALREAEALFGAPRLLAALPDDFLAKRYSATQANLLMEILLSHPEWERVCVLLSGDLGFYSGAKKLLPLIKQAAFTLAVLPGLSTPQYFAAQLHRPWQDWRLVSGHGKDCDVLAEVLNHQEVFFLTDKHFSPRYICKELCAAGLTDAKVWVGERLAEATERISQGTALELCAQEFDALSCVLVENYASFSRSIVTAGIPDKDFVRGEVPMTKREVRAVALSLLQIRATDLLFDIGAGTGSVSVEMALQARRGRVFAIEVNEEAQALIIQNRQKFGTYNLKLVPGMAPLVLQDLPKADAAFIGGSKGQLRRLFERLLELNPEMRLVVSAISLETLHEAITCMHALHVRGVEVVQIASNRALARAHYHILTAQNPIFLISGGGREA